MRVYYDSSALIKRSVEEPESEALDSALEDHIAAGSVILSSTLAWIEVSRALRGRLGSGGYGDEETRQAIERALSGVTERLITEDVVSLARRIGPTAVCTLDAIHLATAILLDVDIVVGYDDRLLDACRSHALATSSPGR
jgi:predicted nucleic acid-binding protein